MQENPYNNFVIVESATKLHSYTTETLLQTFHLGLGVISKLYMQKPIYFAIINNKTPFTLPKRPPPPLPAPTLYMVKETHCLVHVSPANK